MKTVIGQSLFLTKVEMEYHNDLIVKVVASSSLALLVQMELVHFTKWMNNEETLLHEDFVFLHKLSFVFFY